jgi:sarcosine oxidase subunit alpha
MPEQSMPEQKTSGQIQITVDRRSMTVAAGSTVAAAIALAGLRCRTSITGEPRGPLCAMGICFECRATVNGIAHSRTCQLLCEPAMDIRTE